MHCSIALILTVVVATFMHSLPECEANRTFVVDWENNRFLKDGEPFRFISGSFHYFRSHPDSWQRKLRTMRAAGLVAVTTYVEWSLHNPRDGVYLWDGIANLERFIKYAIAEDLLVILRPGPYICAERDFGGFPYWLVNKYPGILLRTADVNYLFEVRVWYSVLMSKLAPYLYRNGGPIIMVQVENEYGSYFACDKAYRRWLRDETLNHVKDKAVLFTNDGPDMLQCGHIENVLPTMDFGSDPNLNKTWSKLRRFMPKGPLVNAEYYPGWLTHWSESAARVPTDEITNTLTEMLDNNASVNIYVFYGGTNFGFTNGANNGGPSRYQPDITSYDYDAPMNEAGDPTPKYYRLRDIIGRYIPLPNIPVPEPQPKRHYGKLQLLRCCSLLSSQGRKMLATGVVISNKPRTFEDLNQFSGLMLYENLLPKFRNDPIILRAGAVHDRAYVYVNGDFVGIMSRETPTYSLPLSASASGGVLQILVENQGRINYGDLNDLKGLTKDVQLGKKVLRGWNMTKYPLESYSDIENFIKQEGTTINLGYSEVNAGGTLRNGPAIFYGVLNIESGKIADTYLDPTGWGKGVLFVNGENLGRYWPLTGPQTTLYVPQEVLKEGPNQIVLIEYQYAAKNYEVTFTDKPIWSS